MSWNYSTSNLNGLVNEDGRARTVANTGMAGVGGLELRNVVAKHPFERSHRFPVIQPNSGRRNYSCSSCGGRSYIAISITYVFAVLFRPTRQSNQASSPNLPA